MGSPISIALAALAFGAPGCADLEITLSQTTSSAIANGIACGDGGAHVGAIFYRVFAPSDHDIADDFSITRVTFALQSATGVGGEAQPAQAIVYRYTGAVGGESIDILGLERLAEADFSMADTAAPREVDVPVPVTIPAGTPAFAVAIYILDVTGVRLYQVGTSNLGESRPGYIFCEGYGVPRSFAALGFPSDHLILTVTGSEATELEPPVPVVVGR